MDANPGLVSEAGKRSAARCLRAYRDVFTACPVTHYPAPLETAIAPEVIEYLLFDDCKSLKMGESGKSHFPVSIPETARMAVSGQTLFN